MKQSYTVERGALDGVEAFLRVAERRSFRQAADDLGVSPSAISQAVRTLETPQRGLPTARPGSCALPCLVRSCR